MDVVASAPLGGAVAISGAAAAELTLRALIDRYMAEYAGRDHSRSSRTAWWVERLGDRKVLELTDSDVFDVLEAYAEAPARRYMGRDADGRPIYRSLGGKPSASSVNRRHAALSAVFSWAKRRRVLPRTFVNPMREIARRREKDGRVRFLSADERARLLAAARDSKWDRLYLLVLMAATTGARKGELLRLTWGDIELERAIAYVAETKNADPRVLPLVPAVVDELRCFESKRRDVLVFGSKRRPKQPYVFTQRWYAALQAAGVRAFRFHDLRHSFASGLAQDGATLLEIADALGHRDLKMTRRYSHLTVQNKVSVVNRVYGNVR